MTTAIEALAALAERLQARLPGLDTDAADYDRDDMPTAAANLRGQAHALRAAIDQARELTADLAGETEPNTDEQYTALTEHLAAKHDLQVGALGQPSLVELSAVHGQQHDAHNESCCLTHDLDGHQPVQDRATELARQRHAQTAGVTS